MSDQFDNLREYLSQKGHSIREIEVIMRKLVAYEDAMVRDSIFDSIANGTFNLDALVKEALEQDKSDDKPDSEAKEAAIEESVDS